MASIVRCPKCNQLLRVPAKKAGLRPKCPVCGTYLDGDGDEVKLPELPPPVSKPESGVLISVECPKCRWTLTGPIEGIGEVVTCKVCKTKFRLQGNPPAKMGDSRLAFIGQRSPVDPSVQAHALLTLLTCGAWLFVMLAFFNQRPSLPSSCTVCAATFKRTVWMWQIDGVEEHVCSNCNRSLERRASNASVRKRLT